jgi:hypothetical protein
MEGRLDWQVGSWTCVRLYGSMGEYLVVWIDGSSVC